MTQSLELHRLSEDVLPFDLLCLLEGRTLFPHLIKMPSLLLYLVISYRNQKTIFVIVSFKSFSLFHAL